MSEISNLDKIAKSLEGIERSLEEINKNIKNQKSKPKKINFKEALTYIIIGIGSIILFYYLYAIFESITGFTI